MSTRARRYTPAAVALLVAACGARHRGPDASPTAPAVETPPDASVVAQPTGLDLEPGTLRTFGVVLPVGAVERLSTDASRVYEVEASVPRVMRYLERRIEVVQAEVHPLGAMVRGARVRAPANGQGFVVDVGVRADGDRTTITLWNRTPVPIPPRSIEDGLRAAGLDPRTGRPLPQNNY
jgi:hypothetical protein